MPTWPDHRKHQDEFGRDYLDRYDVGTEKQGWQSVNPRTTDAGQKRHRKALRALDARPVDRDRIDQEKKREIMAQTKEGAVKYAAKMAGLTLPEYIERVSRGLKKCCICKQWKEVSLFDKDSSRHDGISSKCKECHRGLWRIKLQGGPQRKPRRQGDKTQARQRINQDVKRGIRPDPNDLHCVLCGHKGEDKRHEYHHVCGYEPEHHYGVMPFCSTCHHQEEKRINEQQDSLDG